MELFREPFLTQPFSNFINSFGHNQAGAVDLLGQKVSHGSPNRSGHADDVATAMHEGELTVDFTDLPSISAAQSLNGFADGHVEDEVPAGIQQIHKSLDVRVSCHA
jgi:hypothetical protein